MPQLAHTLNSRIAHALELVNAGEGVHSQLLPSSPVCRAFHPARLQLLYELAYLRVFITWESFLEQSFLRYLCGYTCGPGPETLLQPRCRSVPAAARLVLGSSNFVSWQNTQKILSRCRQFVDRGRHETVIRSHQSRLDSYAAIRNHIAHRSAHSTTEFDRATIALSGHRFRGSSAGLFLRSRDVSSRRWLVTVAKDLINLSAQIVP